MDVLYFFRQAPLYLQPVVPGGSVSFRRLIVSFGRCYVVEFHARGVSGWLLYYVMFVAAPVGRAVLSLVPGVRVRVVHVHESILVSSASSGEGDVLFAGAVVSSLVGEGTAGLFFC